MDQSEVRVLAVSPWMALIDALERSLGLPRATGVNEPPAAAIAQRAHRVLLALQGADPEQALAAGGMPIQAALGAERSRFESSGRYRDERPARALRDLWCDRDAVLRMGLWGELAPVAAAASPAEQGATFDRLMAAISHPHATAGPGLQPSRDHGGRGGFAASAAAAVFFNQRLRKTLANLSRLYDDRGAAFERWLLPDYRPGESPIEPWSRAWTIAVVATYVDWLNRASGGSIAAAVELIWSDQPKRFRPPAQVLRQAEGVGAGEPRPAALPTDADSMHFDLLTQIVLAQLIDYKAERWAQLRDGTSRFAVALSMKALGQADSRHRDESLGQVRNFTTYRGLTIVQIYMAASIDLLRSLAQRTSAEYSA